MSAMKRLLALGMFVALCLAEETQVLADDWQLMRILGADAGWVRTRSTRRGDIVETVVETNIVMRRAGAEIAIAVTETVEERASDGSYVRIRSARKMSAEESVVEIRFEGTKAILKTTVAGNARETEKECGEGLVGPHRIEQLTNETGLKQGATLEVKTYLTDLGGPVTLTVTVGGEEEVELLDGKKERLVRVETAIKGIPLKPVTWVDAQGNPKKTFVNAAGVPMETFAATEERARKAAGAPSTPAPDVFDQTLLAPLHPIPFPRRLERATYRIRSKEEMPDLADGRQTVEQTGDGAILLKIDRKVPPDGRTGTRPIEKPAADLASCLAANSMVQSDAPEIAAIARETVGDVRDAWKAAQTLEVWVHDNIKDKNMDIGFASALEVCRNREGDCTEHAVLLCALCRAAGIPSRVAMGLVCIGNAFGGHAWTEVWTDGDWYALDGTLGQGSVDPTHITLGRMALEDNAGPEGFLGLLQGLGNLEIDPVEVVLDGRALRPKDDAARIEGARYESRLWGVAFTCPVGFVFDPPGPRAAMTTRLMELDGKTAKGKKCEIEIGVADAAFWEMVRGRSDVEEFELDGRPALRSSAKDKRRVCVLANGGAFMFELDKVEGDAEVAAFEEFLASVDFDVK